MAPAVTQGQAGGTLLTPRTAGLRAHWSSRLARAPPSSAPGAGATRDWHTLSCWVSSSCFFVLSTSRNREFWKRETVLQCRLLKMSRVLRPAALPFKITEHPRKGAARIGAPQGTARPRGEGGGEALRTRAACFCSDRCAACHTPSHQSHWSRGTSGHLGNPTQVPVHLRPRPRRSDLMASPLVKGAHGHRGRL